MKQNNRQQREIYGGGPWVFQPDEIAPGDTYSIDLRNMEHHGQKGFFREFLPMDVALITNQHDESPVLVRVSHENEGYVPAGTMQTFDSTPISHIEIENQGALAISSPDLTIELQDTGYDADEQARERKSMGPLRSIVRQKIGL